MRRFILRVLNRIDREFRDFFYFIYDIGEKILIGLHVKRPHPLHLLPSREAFSALIPRVSDGLILEIGPLNRPTVTGPNVRYFDLLPTAELRAKAKAANLDPSSVPVIDYWDSHGNLGIIKERFASVVSSHVVEHQPDLVRHLNSVASLLDESGKYFLVIPDKRYCFDHFLPESRLTEIVRAHNEGRTVPDLYSVIEHKSLITHNDPAKHWRGKSGLRYENLKQKWEGAGREFAEARGAYIDVHIWQFTPESFVAMIDGLSQLGLINFHVESTFRTPRNTLEFYCILRKSES